MHGKPAERTAERQEKQDEEPAARYASDVADLEGVVALKAGILQDHQQQGNTHHKEPQEPQ